MADDMDKQIDELVDRFASAVKAELKKAVTDHNLIVTEMVYNPDNPSALIEAAFNFNLTMCGARAALLSEFGRRQSMGLHVAPEDETEILE